MIWRKSLIISRKFLVYPTIGYKPLHVSPYQTLLMFLSFIKQYKFASWCNWYSKWSSYLDINILRKAQAPHLFQGGNSLLMIFKLYPAIACYQSIHVRHQNKLIISVTQTRQSNLWSFLSCCATNKYFKFIWIFGFSNWLWFCCLQKIIGVAIWFPLWCSRHIIKQCHYL